MFKNLVLGVALFSIFFGTEVSAQSGYVEFLAGQSELSTGFDSTSVSIYGGSSLSENFAIEGGFIDYGSFTDLGITAEISAFTIGGKFFLPLEENFAAHFKMGMAFYEIELLGLTDDEEDLYFGFGGSYRVSDKMALTFDWMKHDFGAASMKNLGFGLAVDF